MQRADSIQAGNDTEAALLSFYTLLMQKRFEEWGKLFTEDAVQTNPFMPDLPGLDSEFRGRDRIVFHYSTVLKDRKDHVFYIKQIHNCGDSAIVEVNGRSTVPETGRVYDQHYVMVFTFRDRKIATLKEYFNPLIFQDAFKGFLVGEGAIEH